MPPKESKNWIFLTGEDLAQNRASGIFYALKSFRGLPDLFQTTKQKDKRKAKQKLPQLIKEHLEKHQDGKLRASESPTVGQVIDEMEAGQGESKPLRRKTIKKRSFYFKRLRSELKLEHYPIASLSLPVWTERLAKVRAAKKRRTFWDYVKHMNIVIRYAYERKYISHYITFPNPDGAHEEGTVFTTAEIRALYEVMGESTRDQFVLAYECCMRLREALHLTWDRVDLESGEITLRPEDVKTGSKTKKGRKFIMTPRALERLRIRKERQLPASRWVFPSPTGKGPIDDNKIAWNRAKRDVLEGDAIYRRHELALGKAKALELAGEGKGRAPTPHFQHWGTWHHLRHTAISRMLVEQGMNITLVSEYVGTSVSTLQRVYLHSKAEYTRGVTQLLRVTD